MTVELVLGGLLVTGLVLFGVTKVLQRRLDRYEVAEADQERSKGEEPTGRGPS